MAARKAYTYRKWEGDDIYSWAVFYYGQVVYSGLSRDSAKWECDRLNAKLLEGDSK